MKMNSIFTKLNLLILIAIISISSVFFIFLEIQKGAQRHFVINEALHINKGIRKARKENIAKLTYILKEDGFEIVANKKEVLKNAKPLFKKPQKTAPKKLRPRITAKKLQILKKGSDIYFYINLPRQKILIKSKPYQDQTKLLILLYILAIGVIIFIYIALKKNLLPIKKLESEIKKFGEGSLDIDVKSSKKDEIARVANEFDKAVGKIRALQNTRTLFLRNIMHELKTPITKGKLLLSLEDDSGKQTKRLDDVFNRLDALINEMADIEKITAREFELIRKKHRLIDIVDNACDLLFLDKKQINHDLASQSVDCDFKLFSIAVKNLIDNALKYGSDKNVKIEANEKEIKFVNKGAALKETFENYTEPFYKEELTHRKQKGFGLGLYIVNEILKKHGFGFEYVRQNEENIFTITDCIS